MEIMLAILVGVLSAVGVYMLLRRSFLKLVLGIIFLSNAVNLTIFIAAGLVRGKPAFATLESANPAEMADPIPQALILTAIVIGFGIAAFTLALKYKYFFLTDTDDLDELKETEE
ncbi:MAG: cation:proton antiporter [Desulfatiglans sp.]|jgi:multicomponent Na+:H+ antiporter subunit C|nr:cation:proton antiporter [Desulfatiglans sp.]